MEFNREFDLSSNTKGSDAVGAKKKCYTFYRRPCPLHCIIICMLQCVLFGIGQLHNLDLVKFTSHRVAFFFLFIVFFFPAVSITPFVFRPICICAYTTTLYNTHDRIVQIGYSILKYYVYNIVIMTSRLFLAGKTWSFAKTNKQKISIERLFDRSGSVRLQKDIGIFLSGNMKKKKKKTRTFTTTNITNATAAVMCVHNTRFVHNLQFWSNPFLTGLPTVTFVGLFIICFPSLI